MSRRTRRSGFFDNSDSEIMNRSTLKNLGITLLFVLSCTHSVRTEDGVAKPAPIQLGSLRPEEVARQVDRLISIESKAANVVPELVTDDEAFIRRAFLAIAGKPPTAVEIESFSKDAAADKRARLVDTLVASPSYARHWARYWRATLLEKAQDQRGRSAGALLEEWLFDELATNRSWKEITRKILTTTGPVDEVGPNAWILGHAGEAVDLAADTSRVFLGIQLQCAQCHHHPYDKWKREQFHELAAFFSRVRLQRSGKGPRSFVVKAFEPQRRDNDRRRRNFFANGPEGFLQRFDADRNDQLSRAEFPRRFKKRFDRIRKKIDADKNGTLSLSELKMLPIFKKPRRKDTGEHFMPDLESPDLPGTQMQPVFFLDAKSPGPKRPDAKRRGALVTYITNEENPWFSRAFVNRVWAELIGASFVEPVDDMGPKRSVRSEPVLDLVAEGFTKSGYDIRWLFQTIGRTEAFQRTALARSEADSKSIFASAYCWRLTADQILDALTLALGIDPKKDQRRPREVNDDVDMVTEGTMMALRNRNPLRNNFRGVFGYDPSTPQGDIVGSIQQALLLMNSRLIHRRIAARRGPVAQALRQHDTDGAVVESLYLKALARRPNGEERAECLKYVNEIGDRREAFEDIFWCLLNSTEFVTRR